MLKDTTQPTRRSAVTSYYSLSNIHVFKNHLTEISRLGHRVENYYRAQFQVISITHTHTHKHTHTHHSKVITVSSLPSRRPLGGDDTVMSLLWCVCVCVCVFVCVCVCVCVCVIEMTWNWATVVVLDTVSKPTDFGLKRTVKFMVWVGIGHGDGLGLRFTVQGLGFRLRLGSRRWFASRDSAHFDMRYASSCQFRNRLTVWFR